MLIKVKVDFQDHNEDMVEVSPNFVDSSAIV